MGRDGLGGGRSPLVPGTLYAVEGQPGTFHSGSPTGPVAPAPATTDDLVAEPSDPWSGDTYVLLADGSFTYWQGEIGGWSTPDSGTSSPSSLPHITDPADGATIPLGTYTFHGTTAPNAQALIFVRVLPGTSDISRGAPFADASGNWTADVILTATGPGEYLTWCRSVIGGQSAYSPVVHMTVT